jgi:putative ABC transport system permease protein
VSAWRQLSRGLRRLGRRAAVERELADELGHFLAEAEDAHRDRGLSAEAARRAALVELGGETAAAEQVRGYGWENLVSGTLADVRYAVRRLRGAPGFTLVGVLTLALGIGATTAIFSAVGPVLLEPLPYPRADRLVTVWERFPDGSRLETTFATARAVADRSHSLESLALARPWRPTLTGRGAPGAPAVPERLDGQRVTAGYFDVLGVAPALGRGLAASDDRRDAPRVVVLSDALWRRRFHAEPAILGRSVDLDGDAYAVVGVMPP